MNDMKSPRSICSIVLSIALFGCLLSLPYGYYTLVRFSTMVLALCWVYRFLKDGARALAITAGAIALLFQPFFKFTLDKYIWNIVDVALAISLVVLAWRYRTK